MLQSFLTFLGGEPGEEQQMILLLLKGFFMGIFIATYQVGAETLFITEVGKEYLDTAFFMAGGAGIFSTLLFVELQKRVRFSRLVFWNSMLVFIFVGFMRAAFWLFDYDELSTDFQWMPFVMFVMIGPATATTVLGFWGVFGRIFDLKQSKRIIGGIDTGQLVATMIGFFSIPVLTTSGVINDTHDLLFISLLSSIGILLTTLWIIINYSIDDVTRFKNTDKKISISYADLWKDKYLRLLCLFMIFSMGSSVFADYIYFSATEIMYPVELSADGLRNEDESLRNFLSFTSGAVMVVSFIIQSFINDIIIGRYGLKVSLMVMPLTLVLFMVAAIFSGHIFEYEVKNEDFWFFFIFLVMGKVLTSSLKDALESPAYKLFFLPFDVKIRFDIQSRIEGVVNQVAILAAGAFQIGLGLLTFFKLIHYAYFVLALAGLIIYYAIQLYTQYKTQLKKTLEIQKKNLGSKGTKNNYNAINILKTELRHKDYNKQFVGLKLMERLEPILADFSLLDFIRSLDANMRAFCYRRLNKLMNFQSLDILKRELSKEDNDDVYRIADVCIANLSKLHDYELTEIGIKKLVRSTDVQHRIFAARVLSKLKEERYIPFLLELLKDINPVVRHAAIMSAGKLKRPEFWDILIEYLSVTAFANSANSALVACGHNVLNTLEAAFYKTGQNLDTMIHIVQIYGRIGGRTGIDLLWKKIDYPDKNITSELLLSLSYIGFKANKLQQARIHLMIDVCISDIAWNTKVLTSIKLHDRFDKMIENALEEENKKNFDHMFMLLSMIYDSQNIKLVKDNIELGTTESVSFGIEMLGIFVDENMKPKLYAALDDAKVEDKLKKLGDFYPPEYFEDYSDVLLQIINRNYNDINKWTKCLALYKLSLIPGQRVTDDLIANLFNPDVVMLETAGFVIYRLDKNSYHTHTARLKPNVKKLLDKAVVPPVFKKDDDDYHQKLLVIERAILLRQIDCFKSIPGVFLLDLAAAFEEITFRKGSKLIDIGDHGNVPLSVLVKGDLEVEQTDGSLHSVDDLGIVGHDLVLVDDRSTYKVIAREDSVVLSIEKDKLYYLISKNVELVEGILHIVNEGGMTRDHKSESTQFLGKREVILLTRRLLNANNFPLTK